MRDEIRRRGMKAWRMKAPSWARSPGAPSAGAGAGTSPGGGRSVARLGGGEGARAFPCIGGEPLEAPGAAAGAWRGRPPGSLA